MFYFDLYHQSSKNKPEKKGSVTSHQEWPAEWKTVYYKTYPRLPEFVLPKPKPITQQLSETLLTRSTTHTFTRQTIELAKIASLLFYSVGVKPNQDKRMYASAGARYPIETYVLFTDACELIPAGLYHYNVPNHSLTQISQQAFTPTQLHSYALDSSIHDASFTIFLTGVFSRTAMKYKERAYRFCLLEAGEMTQNFSLCAAALDLRAMSLGGTIDTEIEALLDIDGVEESLLHTICFS